MYCESCQRQEACIELAKIPSWQSALSSIPYRLCEDCNQRLQQFALRPLEFFHLKAIHTDDYWLHDDFYDEATGEAYQPEVEVENAQDFLFPSLLEVAQNLDLLVDFAFVQFVPNKETIACLQQFPVSQLLNRIEQKMAYNPGCYAQAYELVGVTLGMLGRDWALAQWHEKAHLDLDLLIHLGKLLANCLEVELGFRLVSEALTKLNPQEMAQCCMILSYFRTPASLRWLEQYAPILGYQSSFAAIASLSNLDWATLCQWLEAGRPLSHVALEALQLCTLQDYAGQSLMIMQHQLRLLDMPDYAQLEKELQAYLAKDNVPKVRKLVEWILG